MVDTTKRFNRHAVVKIEAYIVLLLLVLLGGVIGRVTAPTKVETVTVTETVEVPSYETDTLPEITEVTYYNVPLSHSLQKYITEICAEKEVPVRLVLAMIETESNFDPEVISETDDYGLMQINEINLEELSEKYKCADMLDPYQNVFCGVQIISEYLTKYEGDTRKALMAYNMGEYGAQKAWADGTETTNYTEKVMSLMLTYEEVMDVAAIANNE